MIVLHSVQGSALTATKTVDIKQQDFQSVKPMVMSVCADDAGNLLIGTRGAEIIHYPAKGGKVTELMRAHFDSELWGLAAHNTEAKVYTVGRD